MSRGGFQHGAGFRLCGAIVRRHVIPGKVAFMTIEVHGHPKSRKHDLKAFAAEVLDEIAELGAGQTVEVTGAIDAEKVTDKKRNAIMVDGREKWVPSLVIKKITVEGSSRRPAPDAAAPPANGAAPPPRRRAADALMDDDGPSDLDNF